MTQNRSAGYWLALIGKIILAVAMLLYLGKHSLNFFMWTFQGEDEIYAWLGLMTTSIGAIIWLAILKWNANTTWEKAIAMIMLFTSLLGEFAVAGFDMFMNITKQFETQSWTAADLQSMSYVVAGLALLNGLALVADIAGMDIFDALSKKDQPIPAPSVFQPAIKHADTSIAHFVKTSPVAPAEGATKQIPFQPE